MPYQVMPNLSAEDYEALKTDIAERGVQVPVEYDESGNILDGYHRTRACQELGIIEWPKVIRRGFSEEQKRVHARKLNMARRHLTQEQKRELVRQQLMETPEVSDRQIGKELGVSDKTVGTQRKGLQARAEIPHLDKIRGADGKAYPIVARRPHVANNSGNNEWYTPSEYIEAARCVLGEIDLDPASSALANETVRAKLYFTAEENGLDKEWAGRVWINPPYSAELLVKFCKKIVFHVQNGDIPQAIVLVNNATETNWFNLLVRKATAVVFPKGRVKFVTQEGKMGSPLQGQAVLYFGPNPSEFLKQFKPMGWGGAFFG